MEKVIDIQSPRNPRVKAAVRLRTKARARREEGKTLIEGFREIRRAVENGWQLLELYYCPELFSDPAETNLVRSLQKGGLPIFRCSEEAFRRMSYRESPDGLLALSPLAGKKLSELDLPENPLLLIVEDIEKPGNLGTLLRTADAAGVDAVLVCDPRTDLNNPNVIRAAMGTLFFLPVVETTSREALDWLEEHAISIAAALPDAETDYTAVPFDKPIAVAVGSEDDGLSPIWSERAQWKISIPMLGRNDSLNVSAAAAVLLYEAVRQRRTIH